jgi:lipopolysaccharide transport system ATP-binding protein
MWQPVSSALDRVSSEAIAWAADKVVAVEINYDMNHDVIIRVEGLGKRYSIRHQRERYTALRDVIADSVRAPFRRLRNRGRSKIEDRRSGNGSPSLSPSSQLPAPRTSKEDFWALKNVSFEVRRGEVLGIIGRNGAGKSTLLKILSRITEPTEGRVRIRGRVASLLEVGTGFHPELTGRENIFLNGAILGMSRAEIKAKFDEIVAFAETEKFLDTPVKRYSSGMYVRLAFAVAAHLEPEILVVDEVLAVGDAEFQKKCLGKMKEVSSGGRTVLFVSHNMAAVQSLCDNALLLASGTLRFRGSSSETVTHYISPTRDSADGINRQLSKSLALASLGCEPSTVERGKDLLVSIEMETNQDETISDLALLIHSSNGERASLIDLRPAGNAHRLIQNEKLKIQVRISQIPFVEGDFNIGLYVNADSVCQSFMNIAEFTVLPDSSDKGYVPREPQFRGLVELASKVDHQIDRAVGIGPRLSSASAE